jgi:hypothetical protein
MKIATFLNVILLTISLNALSQDSTKITIAPQTRDVEYISSFLCNSYEGQEVFDSIKAKMRVANPPTGITTISLTGYTADWLGVYRKLYNDPMAIKGGIKGRIEALLRGVGQVYLTSVLDAMDSADVTTIITMRIFGRNRARRL